MRGKASFTLACDFDHRITPAYAGKRSIESLSCSGSRDHPRLCGEKSPKNRDYGSTTGSPPPMRGKEDSDIALATEVRITPAYAGKSSRSR